MNKAIASIILCLMTMFIIGCGGGGGASGPSGVGITVPTPTPAPDIIYQYDIYMDGQGGWFASVIYTDFTLPTQVETPFQVNGVSAQGAGITKFGRNLFGQIVNRGTTNITFRIVRDQVEILNMVLQPDDTHNFIYDVGP